EQALARLHNALTLAHELSHPYSLAYARWVVAMAYQFRRDVSSVYEHAEAIVALSTEQGFTQWAAWERACMDGRWPCRARARRGWRWSARGSPSTEPPGQRCSSHTLAPYGRTSVTIWATRQTASRRWPRLTR